MLCSKFYTDGKKFQRDGVTNFKMVKFYSFKLSQNKICIVRESQVLSAMRSKYYNFSYFNHLV